MLYEERVPVVKPKNVIKEEEVACEDTNAFFGKLKDKLKPKAIDRSSVRMTDFTETNGSTTTSGDGERSSLNTTDGSKKDYNSISGKEKLEKFYNSNNPNKNKEINPSTSQSTSNLSSDTGENLIRPLSITEKIVSYTLFYFRMRLNKKQLRIY